MADELLRPAKAPCVSCPYRRDVPAGVWAREEYDKLLDYDGETWAQSLKVFMCHQRDGRLCAGWLGCHDPRHLLALRLSADQVDPSCYGYVSPVPVFASGAEARAHGLTGIEAPGPEAVATILRLAGKGDVENG